jgi:hypothetical protein
MIRFFLYTILCAIWVAPVAVGAQEFVPLSPSLPVGDDVYNQGLSGLLDAFLGVAVAGGAVLAVVMVAIGGFSYMTKESIPAVSNGKDQITNAILGLLIILGSIVILKTINPTIIRTNIFNVSMEPVRLEQSMPVSVAYVPESKNTTHHE